MLGDQVSAHDERPVSGGLVFEDVPRGGHRKTVNRIGTVGGRQLITLAFKREPAIADPVGKRK